MGTSHLSSPLKVSLHLRPVYFFRHFVTVCYGGLHRVVFKETLPAFILSARGPPLAVLLAGFSLWRNILLLTRRPPICQYLFNLAQQSPPWPSCEIMFICYRRPPTRASVRRRANTTTSPTHPFCRNIEGRRTPGRLYTLPIWVTQPGRVSSSHRAMGWAYTRTPHED